MRPNRRLQTDILAGRNAAEPCIPNPLMTGLHDPASPAFAAAATRPTLLCRLLFRAASDEGCSIAGCTLHQVRFECISLDVAADGVEVVVILNGKGFEPPLINVAGSRAVAMGMPALSVRERQPSREIRKLPVEFRPGDKMPVIRHRGRDRCCQRPPAQIRT